MQCKQFCNWIETNVAYDSFDLPAETFAHQYTVYAPETYLMKPNTSTETGKL